MSQVSYGTITITDTTDIERIYTVYAKSANNTTVPSTAKESWSENVSTAPGTGNYIWQRTVVEKSGTGAKTYSDPVCLTGEEGADATEISGIEVRYGISADWNTQPSSWSADTPAYDSSKPKYWTRTRLIYDTNPVTYSDPVYTKDEALTKAVSDSAIANSIAQHANEDAQGAMAQAGSNVNSVTRLWYLTDTASPPDKPSAHVTETRTFVTGQWTRNKPTVANYRYYYYCDEICTGGGIYSWTDVVADTLSLTSYELGLINANIKNHWWDSNGLHFASGINNAEVTTTNSNTYGYIGTLGLNGLTLGYNSYKTMELLTNALNFYQPPTIGSTTSQGKKTMSLTGNALRFYNPSDGTTEQATLDANGLKLLKGGIESGTPLENGYVYFSTEDKAGIEINGYTPGNNDPKWRQIIGTKFGVDSEGKLYANGARISGNIEITSSDTIYTKSQVDTSFDVKGSASEVKTSTDLVSKQLNVVEDVVGANSWLFKYGHFKLTEDTTVNLNKQYYLPAYDYILTSDTSIDTDKTYYIRNGSGTEEDPYTYVAVDSPDSAHLSEYYEYIILNYEPTKVDDINPHEANLYELVSIDEVVADYVSSRLMSTEQGLWITTQVYDYVLTSDINIDTSKTYYIRNGSGTEEAPYVYTIVDSPDSTHLSEYYERIANDNKYRLLLSPDGIYLYGPNGIISKFGENIDFSSEHSQHIGGENSYIEFDSVTQKINIVTDQLTIGNVNPVQKIEDIEQNVVPDLQKTLNEHNTYISTQQDTLNTLTGYVDINSTQSYIRVGKKGADSYVQIDGADTKVAINIKGQDVAYMSGDRFYAPSAVVTTLYMKTELNTDNAIGTIGWIMRSNGHLSLKRVK